MFFLFTRKKEKINENNEKEIIINENNEKEIINENNECLLCLESNTKIFYDYDYENNRYIHNCICKPSIHYLCFKENYELRESCIICLKIIERLPKKKCIYYFIKFIKFKLLLFFCILVYSTFYLFIDFDIMCFHVDSYEMKNEYFQNEDIYYV